MAIMQSRQSGRQ